MGTAMAARKRPVRQCRQQVEARRRCDKGAAEHGEGGEGEEGRVHHR
jgi:hypothetical protein